jgi:cytochrome c-type biogenesis protein CcmH/NrfF
LLPESALALAAAKVPSAAATASMVLFLLLVPSFVSAQSSDATRAVLRKQLEGEILCTCGCRRPMNDCPMEPNCHGLDAQRLKLDKYVGDGMDRDQVLAAFAVDYGTQAILARPIDKGFNRLAWFFPYLIGVSGAVGAVVIARRWSRRSEPAEPSAAAPQEDADLRTRLDDELRDLD